MMHINPQVYNQIIAEYQISTDLKLFGGMVVHVNFWDFISEQLQRSTMDIDYKDLALCSSLLKRIKGGDTTVDGSSYDVLQGVYSAFIKRFSVVGIKLHFKYGTKLYPVVPSFMYELSEVVEPFSIPDSGIYCVNTYPYSGNILKYRSILSDNGITLSETVDDFDMLYLSRMLFMYESSDSCIILGKGDDYES